MANLVTFAKKLWKDATSGGTPITAAELNRVETGISDCATQINALGDSVSRIKTGSTIVRGFDKNNEATLFTKERFVGLCGREYNQDCDYVGVSSGDRAGIAKYPISSSFDRETGAIKVKLTEDAAEAVRINYLIVLGR